MSTEEVVVRVRNLGKLYQRVHEKPMLMRDALFFVAGRARRHEDFWALRNVSFELQRGQALGLLGRNGSGKSTLLQLLAGASFPTEGVVSTKGRVSMLLSLGAGFHPDMTGEENIIICGGLMGFSEEEVKRRLPGIVRFAELEHVIDTQVRYYSSGMLARLGFSIAINVQPDIVVVDEVLAVGDMGFAKKCHEEIYRLKTRGATFVMASQSPMIVAEFCSHALWLHEGAVRASGSARQVASEYARFMEAQA